MNTDYLQKPRGLKHGISRPLDGKRIPVPAGITWDLVLLSAALSNIKYSIMSMTVMVRHLAVDGAVTPVDHSMRDHHPYQLVSRGTKLRECRLHSGPVWVLLVWGVVEGCLVGSTGADGAWVFV